MNEHKKRAKSMCRAIRIAWTSLKSHLQYTIDADPGSTDADELFHAQAVCEYSQAISICAKELRHLTRERKKSGETAKTKEENLPEQDNGCQGGS